MIPKGGHFLKDDIARFDNTFFRISDKEASVSIHLLYALSDIQFCFPAFDMKPTLR